MKTKAFRVISLALLALAIFYAYRWLFPGPEQVIRNRIAALAKAASFSPRESSLSRMYSAQKVAGYFTPQAELLVDIPGGYRQTLSGRDEVTQAALVARNYAQGLTVECVGVRVTLSPDRRSATVNLTAKITAAGDKDWSPQEFTCTLTNTSGDWLIQRAETVRPLH
jgi:hypothetical protein